MGEQHLNFTFTVDEINIILGTLGNQPFVQVSALIGKIKQQAEAQVQPNLSNKTED